MMAPPGFGAVSQPREDLLEVECRLRLRSRLAAVLVMHAAQRRRAPSELLADIIERVLEDDLVVAVLDEGPSS